MTAKVLQLVNSAFFSLPQKVIDPSRAVALLGIENLKPLLLYVHIFSMFDDSKEVSPYVADLWKHSIMVGRLAREIAVMESSVRATIENALTAGILHDIGKLVLLHATRQKTGVDYVSIADEQDLLGASHPAVGAYLLGLWAIPAPVVEVVALHHRPSESGDDGFTALTAVHVADALVSNDSPGSSVIPGLDYNYLEAINKTDRLPQWIECYHRVEEREPSS
jgi:putative nucleotidyltransferase with HDIG domain